MHFEGDTLYNEPDDQCLRCLVRDHCPLLDALTQGVVLMAQESLGVSACNLFKLLKRHQPGRPRLKVL